MTAAGYIYRRCIKEGFTKESSCSLLAQIQRESNFIPNNVENGKGWSDAAYTEAVDSGTYKNFINDGIGYGLWQLTYAPRKKMYLNYCKNKKKSIGDLKTQVDFLIYEMKKSFPGIYEMMKTSVDLYACTKELLYIWENPDEKVENLKVRYQYAQEWLTKANNLETEEADTLVQKEPVQEIQNGSENAASKIEHYVQEALRIASDNSHGYSQANRWGPDFDCSSMVITAVQNAGIPVKTNGATYTGNMRNVFLNSGFKNVTASCNLTNAQGMQRGDILLNDAQHTAIYIGDNKVVHARSSEGNSIPGDQSGNEIRVQPYWNFPWDVVLRFREGSGTSESGKTDDGILRLDSKGPEVLELQKKLMKLGYDLGVWGADGEFGEDTLTAVEAFQRDAGIFVDGEVGPETLNALEKALKAQTEKKSVEQKNDVSKVFKAGDVVEFIGNQCFMSAMLDLRLKASSGKAKITAVSPKAKHPYHLCKIRQADSADIYGWVNTKDIKEI